MKTGQMLGKHYECYDRRRLQYTGTPSRGEGGWGNNYALCNVMLRTETRAFYLQIQFVYKLTTIIFFTWLKTVPFPEQCFPLSVKQGMPVPTCCDASGTWAQPFLLPLMYEEGHQFRCHLIFLHPPLLLEGARGWECGSTWRCWVSSWETTMIAEKVKNYNKY